MLRLPIDSKEPERAAEPDASSRAVKVTVRNTFLDVKPERQIDRGAQSCTARLSDPAAFSFTPDPTPKGDLSTGTWPAFSEEPDPIYHQPEGRNVCVKNTFIQLEDPEQSEQEAAGAKSCVARLGASQHGALLENFNFGQDLGSNYSEAVGYPSIPPPAFAPPAAPPPAGPPPSVPPPAAPPMMPANWLPAPSEDRNLKVKNTFLHIATGNDTPLERGLQTCTARFSDSAPSFLPQSPPKAARDFMHPDNLLAEAMHGLPLTHTRNLTSADALGDFPCSMSNTLFSNASSSPGSGPAMPPPMYEAPNAQLGKRTPPPPSGSALPSGAARLPLQHVEAASPWGAAGPWPGEEWSEPPLREGWMPPVRGADWQSPMAASSAADRGPRLSVPPSSAPSGAVISLGSSLHGTFAADGTPACKPCAWFYKDGSCLNAQACGYCHLCPQGELKNRKKTKIAGLRKAEAEVAAGSSQGAAAAQSPTSAAAARKVFLLSSHLPGKN